jgi:uncharacterized protein (UPF0305 family)
MGEKYISSFIGMFEQKINDMRKKIEKELKKPKKERDTVVLKSLVKQANALKKRVKVAKKATAMKCPHCGKEL